MHIRLRLELKLAYFKMDFLQETIPEAEYNSLVECNDNLQQELKQRALRSYPDNLETDKLRCTLLPDDSSENYVQGN